VSSWHVGVGVASCLGQGGFAFHDPVSSLLASMDPGYRRGQGHRDLGPPAPERVSQLRPRSLPVGLAGAGPTAGARPRPVSPASARRAQERATNPLAFEIRARVDAVLEVCAGCACCWRFAWMEGVFILCPSAFVESCASVYAPTFSVCSVKNVELCWRRFAMCFHRCPSPRWRPPLP
jgi:hypothetical protein